jgi:hypothetical protein
MAQGPTGPDADARLRSAIGARLSQDRLLEARAIEVEVADGVASLTGRVFRAADIALAEMIAAREPGVREVRSTLFLSATQPPPGVPDSLLTEVERERAADEAPHPRFPGLST